MAKALGLTLLVLVVDAALLAIVGVQLQDNPVPADRAVGKGLAALGGALAFAAFVVGIVWLEAMDARNPPAPRVSDDEAAEDAPPAG